MRLHLVNDQQRSSERPKLGLGYISSYLKKYCKDIDISISFKGDDFKGDIKRIKPDLIGLTATTETFQDVIKAGKEIKDTYGLPMMIGGTHISILPEHLPPWIDVGVIGEGEQTILELVENYRKKMVLPDNDIKGIIYREGDKLCQTGVRNLIEPLDIIPSPDWDMLAVSKDGPGHIITSRGCPFKCVFCSSTVFWQKIRFFSPEYVVREIKTIIERYGRKEILIYDDLFTANRKRLNRISHLLCEEGIDKAVRFECLGNVNHFSPEIASSLKRMNVYRISFGMESGSPKMLRYLKKDTVTLEKIRKAIRAGIDNGIEVLGSFMLGVPGETEEDILMTYNFIKNTKITEIGVNIATPFPGTELWDYAVSHGYIKNEWDDSIYGMKTITPNTIEDKKLLCSIDKNRFLALYKMLIDLDSMLIDRRIKLRTMKDLVIDYMAKIANPGRKWRILDVSCEDGTLGAAIKAEMDAEVIGLSPENDFIEDASRRLDSVIIDGRDLTFPYKDGYFDCILLNDILDESDRTRAMIEWCYSLLKDGGVVIGSFQNIRHFSYMAYSLFGIKCPPFETTDGTVQYLKWGIPDKEPSKGCSISNVKTIIERVGLKPVLFNANQGFDNNLIEQFSKLIGTYGGSKEGFKSEASIIRYFFVVQKAMTREKNAGNLKSAAGPDAMNDVNALNQPGTEDVVDRDYFRQERKDVEVLIPREAMKILDVGCGEGALGKRLLERGVREVVGIEADPVVSGRARKNLSRIIQGDVELLEIPFEDGYFDCIVFADVLEHMKEPLVTLKRFYRYLSDSGTIVASIPNVRYYGIINMLVEGHWKYQDHGILDKTHLRFFTKKEIDSLFKEAGFEITGITANIDPLYTSLSNSLSREISFGKVHLKGLSPDELKDLFVIQYLVKAEKAGNKGVHNALNVAIDSGDFSEAIDILEGHLEQHPADTDFLYRHADICYRFGQLDKAIDSIEKLLLLEPERGDALRLKDTIRREV